MLNPVIRLHRAGGTSYPSICNHTKLAPGENCEGGAIMHLYGGYPTFTACGNLNINPGSGIFFCQISFSENLATPG